MSFDGGDLRGSLSTALEDLDCGPLPLNSVIGQGRKVVLRRRLTAVAGALVIAVGAVACLIIAHQVGRPVQPAASKHYHVTVHPPGAKSPSGLIAYGRVNRRHWQVTGSAERVSGQMNVCFDVLSHDCQAGPIPVARDKGAPADFQLAIGSAPMVVIGDVRSERPLPAGQPEQWPDRHPQASCHFRPFARRLGGDDGAVPGRRDHDYGVFDKRSGRLHDSVRPRSDVLRYPLVRARTGRPARTGDLQDRIRQGRRQALGGVHLRRALGILHHRCGSRHGVHRQRTRRVGWRKARVVGV